MKIRVDRRRWRLFLANCILAALVLVCFAIFQAVAGTLESIHAADRFRGGNEMRFAQLACFMPEDGGKSEEDIRLFHQTLDQKLTDASLEAPEGASLYTDAYSGHISLNVTGDHGSATVKAIGVGGNFFQFHPLRLRSGSYISENDFMQDRVVLDETLAWQLFGGFDVAGLSVTIDGKPFYVAGVVRRESDFATKEAYLDGASMFLSYSAMKALDENSTITCYEIVMPDPISGFAHGVLTENFDVGTGDIVENSSRYSLENLFSVIGDFGKRSMRNNGVIYPYWENAVRLTEDYLALLLVLMLLFGLCPAVTLLVLAIRQVIRTWRTLKREVPARLDRARERRREKLYEKGRE
ncbi:MAG TPA: ABC transporter permease [Candidatus Avoscillospira avicola]|uniref:ABC transporter permease n=1 Tax=Candidatus Avoscillospira avicola TaxID=2840706 RepID=A0A9D1DHS4_9FIRM|nr:ABC transporter permease [Candidatus Avoscillospira avicola]